MATVSFTKSIIIKETEAINKFVVAVTDKKSCLSINKELASEKEMERGKVLLKRYLSR